jgi:Family of unknown function (DUF5719)
MSRSAAAVTAVAMVVSAAAVATTGRAGHEVPNPARGSQTVAVSTAVLSCPGATPDSDVDTSVFAAAPVLSGHGAGGVLTVAALSPVGAKAVARLAGHTRAVTVPTGTNGEPTLVHALGSAAPGVTGAQWSLPRGKARGTAVSWCQPPTGDLWFAGADTSVGAASRVVLTNPSSSIAVVSLSFFGPAGEVTVPAAHGIAVAPRSAKVIQVSRFAPALSALTIEVHADQGQISAALHLSRAPDVHGPGVEWVPAGGAPSTDVLVDPAFVSSKSEQRLVITNPTVRDALVQVSVIDADGEFTPVGFTNLRLPPGSVRKMRLGRAAAGYPAVHVTSTAPVVAATVTATLGRSADLAVSASSPDVGEPAVVPVIPGTTLALRFVTAARNGGRVIVGSFDSRGRRLSRDRVRVDGRAVSGWDLPHAGKAAYVVVSKPDRVAGVQAIAQYSSRDGTTALPLVSGSYAVTRPAVTPMVTAP